MEQNLGNVERTLLAPEKIRAQQPIWKDLLTNFVPVAVACFILALLSSGLWEAAGASSATSWIIYGVFAVVLGIAILPLTRKLRQRYNEMRLDICEGGVKGVCPVNTFKSRDFAIPYSALTAVTGKKNRLTLSAGKERVNLILDEAESVAAQLQQRMG